MLVSSVLHARRAHSKPRNRRDRGPLEPRPGEPRSEGPARWAAPAAERYVEEECNRVEGAVGRAV